MERIIIAPAEGKLVRLEDGTRLPEQGAEVIRTTFINRRLNVGDAVILQDLPTSSVPEKRFGCAINERTIQ